MEDAQWPELVEKYANQLAIATQQVLVGQVQLEAAKRRIRELETAEPARQHPANADQ